jgi:hypothetical protein
MEMQRPPKHSGTAQEALLVRSVAVSRVVRPMFRCSHSSLFHFSIFAVSPRLLLEITCVISIRYLLRFVRSSKKVSILFTNKLVDNVWRREIL